MPQRKPREYEKTCTCRAYSFPHRLFGGSCTGRKIVALTYYHNHGGSCSDCILNDCGSCQVISGIEDTKHAPCVQEFIQYEGVRPPIAWREKLTTFNGAA